MGASIEARLAASRGGVRMAAHCRRAHGMPRASAAIQLFSTAGRVRRDLLDGIAEMVRLGVGDVEVHLHQTTSSAIPSFGKSLNTAAA